MDIIDERTPRARKEHKCDFCNKTIFTGEKYFDQVLKNDGELYHWKSCLECEFLCRELWDFIDSWDGTIDGDALFEALDDFGVRFICSECDKFEDIGDPDDPPGRYMECSEGNCVNYECKHKIIEKLFTHQLVYERKYTDKNESLIMNPRVWKLKPRDVPLTTFPKSKL